jgi:serine phosphatase RsbU (regulator of sigma subunit)
MMHRQSDVRAVVRGGPTDGGAVTTMTDGDRPQQWKEELQNFEEIATFLQPSPGEVPELPGIAICGFSIPLQGLIGGDHLVYIDFNKRYDLDVRIREAEELARPEVAAQLRRLKSRAGILVADVSGHRTTDAMICAMLHQAFLLGATYELDVSGEITTRLFEHINTRFHKTTRVNKYFTMIYGEISTEGKFRFISAGHQPPAVFSREFGRFMPISPDRLVSFPPVGMLPSSADLDDRRNPSIYGYKRRYEVNEINLLAVGDILLLHTDGLSEHDGGRYFPAELERLLAAHRDAPADQVCQALRESFQAVAPQADDVTVVVIKKVSE